MDTVTKPLGRKAYGSIGHLPDSRLGPGDHAVHEGQGDICTVKTRDKHDRVIVQEKLDGSCTAVAMIGGELYALGRAGWPAWSSPYEQHKMFAGWVHDNDSRFRAVLKDGERLVGEWLAQVHGTHYHLSGRDPWATFDLMRDASRTPVDEFYDRVLGHFCTPNVLHSGSALPVADAMELHESLPHWPCDQPEGVVYRVERKGVVDFLAKWVRPDKVDGKYLPEVSGKAALWNWQSW